MRFRTIVWGFGDELRVGRWWVWVVLDWGRIWWERGKRKSAGLGMVADGEQGGGDTENLLGISTAHWP